MALARGWKVLLVTSIGVYLVALDVTVVNIAFPDIAEDFDDTSRAALSWILSGYNIAFAAALLTAGRLADRIGRRRVFFAGVGVFTTGSALCGLAPNVEALVAARVLQALGGALLLPASLALVLPEFPVERRSAAIGIWGAIGGVAAATGPSLGSALVESVGWRWVFFVNAPACLIAWLAGRRLLVESRDPNASRWPDVLGAVLGVGAVGFLVLAIVQGDDWGYTDTRTIGAATAAVLLLPLFLARCAVRTDPALDLSLFRRRFFSVGNGATFIFSIAFFAMIFVNVLFLTTVWQYSVLGAGLALTPGPLMAAVTAGPAGRLADRFGHRAVVAPGTLLVACGLAWISMSVGTEPSYWRDYFPGNLLAGAGVGFTIATLSAASNAFLPPDRFGMGSAFNATCRQVGSAIGIASAVAIIGEPSPAEALGVFDDAWAFMIVTTLVSGAVMLAFYRRPDLSFSVPNVAELSGRRTS